nr:DUF3017 domain-containing protein [Williamsia deligens]
MPSSGRSVASVHRARRIRWLLVQIPFALVALFVIIAFAFVVADRWRRGAFVFGGAALLASVLRALLPASRVGLLQVRGRFVDVVATALTGGLIIWLAASIDALGTGVDQ